MAREKRSLSVRAHICRLWRCLVKKLVPMLVLVGELKKMIRKMMNNMMMNNNDDTKNAKSREQVLTRQTQGR